MKLFLVLSLVSITIYAGNWHPENHPGNLCEAKGGKWAWNTNIGDFGCLFNDNIEENQKKLITDNPYLIKQIENPSKELQLIAIKNDPTNIQYIKNPDKEIQMIAVEKDATNIRYIETPEIDVQLVSIQENPMRLQYIKNPSQKVELTALKKDDYVIKYILNPTIEMQQLAIDKNPQNLQYLKNPDESVVMQALKKDGKVIQYINNPSSAMQLKAIENDPQSIYYISNPDIKIKSLAVKKDPTTLKYISESDPYFENLKAMAMKQDSKWVNAYLEEQRNIKMQQQKFEQEKIAKQEAKQKSDRELQEKINALVQKNTSSSSLASVGGYIGGINGDMAYRNGQNFIRQYYNYYNLGNDTRGRDSETACRYFAGTYAGERIVSRDWLDGCASALSSKR